MLDEIIGYAKMLNRKDILPETYLRKNSIYYSFVSYINYTIALFISEDYDDVASDFGMRMLPDKYKE